MELQWLTKNDGLFGALQEEFCKNCRGINDGGEIPREYMLGLYERITTNEIKMKDEALIAGQGAAPAAKHNDSLFNFFQVCLAPCCLCQPYR